MHLNSNAAHDLAAWHKFRNAAEGGLSFDRHDTSNYFHGVLVGSNRGITPATLADWLDRLPTRHDMVALTETQVNKIAEALYWEPCGGPHLPSGVNLQVADFGFNAGVATSIRMLQRALGRLAVDGVFGSLTAAAAHAAAPDGLIVLLHDRQADYYRALDNKRYLRGWLQRNDERRDLARKLAGI